MQTLDFPALRLLIPFAVLFGLLIVGAVLDLSRTPIHVFITLPKRALMFAAILAMLDIPPADRSACLDSAVRRTGSLLFVIGAASAFRAMLAHRVPLSDVFPTNASVLGVLGLFAPTALFKLTQRSGMATSASIGSIATPIVAGSGMSPFAAVFAICLGSFVAIMPNDSFYRLTRNDALDSVKSDSRAVWILADGASIQELTGLTLLLATVMFGLI